MSARVVWFVRGGGERRSNKKPMSNIDGKETEQMSKGFATITPVIEKPQPQTASNGAFNGGKRKAPPHTPYKKRPYKIGDRIRTPNKEVGIIIKIRSNGHIDYLVNIPKIGQKWYSEFEI